MRIPFLEKFRNRSVSPNEGSHREPLVVLEGVNIFDEITPQQVDSYAKKLKQQRGSKIANQCGSVDVKHYRRKLTASNFDGSDFLTDHSIVCGVIVQRCMRRHTFPSLPAEGVYLEREDLSLFKALTSASWFDVKGLIREVNIDLGHGDKIDLAAIIRALPYLRGHAQLEAAQGSFLAGIDTPEPDELDDDEGEGDVTPAMSASDPDPDDQDEDQVNPPGLPF